MLKVIGLGNLLRGDDCVGPVVVREIAEGVHAASMQAIDAGADAFILLEHLLGSEPVLIVDCADMGLNPGQFVKFEVTEANLKQLSSSISLHGFSFAEVYQMARKMGRPAPCTVVGVQPKTIDFNSTMSFEVRQNIPLIIDAIVEEAKKYG